jgi:hypothetical protein
MEIERRADKSRKSNPAAHLLTHFAIWDLGSRCPTKAVPG